MSNNEYAYRISNNSMGAFRESTAIGCSRTVDAGGSSMLSFQDSNFSYASEHAVVGQSAVTMHGDECDLRYCGATRGAKSGAAISVRAVARGTFRNCDVSGSETGVWTEGEVDIGGLISDGCRHGIVVRPGGGVKGAPAVTNSSVVGVSCEGGDAYIQGGTVTGSPAGKDLVVADGGSIRAVGVTTTNRPGAPAIKDTSRNTFNAWNPTGIIVAPAT